MSERESSRLIALREAVDHCLQLGMSKAKIVEICKAEVFGAAKLRQAVQDCLSPDKVVRMSYYEHVVDKKIANEEILAVVNQVSKAVQT